MINLWYSVTIKDWNHVNITIKNNRSNPCDKHIEILVRNNNWKWETNLKEIGLRASKLNIIRIITILDSTFKLLKLIIDDNSLC